MGIEQSHDVTTLAGSGADGCAEGTGSDAQIGVPTSVTVDVHHNVYATDSKHHVIWKVTPEGVATIFAGKAGDAAFADGAGGVARFHTPTAIYSSSDRTRLFVCDSGNRRVRGLALDGVVCTVAGDGTAQSVDSDEKHLLGCFRNPTAVSALSPCWLLLCIVGTEGCVPLM
jgi:hypothetical protein